MTWQSQEWKDKAEEFVKGKYCEWHGPTCLENLVPHLTKKNLTHDQYMDLEKYCFVLCKNCNFQESLGKRLCPVCKEHYYKPKKKREPMCFTCFSKTPYGQIVAKYREDHPDEFPKRRRRKVSSKNEKGVVSFL